MKTSRPKAQHHRSRRFSAGRWALSALMFITMAGCTATSRGTDGNPFARSERAGPIRVEVANDHFNDARIYAIWGGQRHRIGTVTGKTQEIIEFDWRPHDLRIQVDLIAAGGFTTDPLAIWPGETLYLQIPPRL